MAKMNFLYLLRDVYRDIDRSLDARDQKEFNLASRQLRNVMSRLRDHIDNISAADIPQTRRTR